MKINFLSLGNDGIKYSRISTKMGRKKFIIIHMSIHFVEIDFHNHGKVIGTKTNYFTIDGWHGTHNWVKSVGF